VLAVLIGLAAIPAVGGSHPPGADGTIPTVGPAGLDATGNSLTPVNAYSIVDR